MEGIELETCERIVAAEIAKLQLEVLDSKWVKEVIENDFLHFQDIPDTYLDHFIEFNPTNEFQNIHKFLCKWIEYNQSFQEDTHKESFGCSNINSSLSSKNPYPELSNRGSKFWRFLFQDENINIDSFLALLGYLLDRGSTLTCSSIKDRHLSFSAANLYFAMISVPGSMAFRVFHQMLFAKAMQLVSFYVQAMKHYTRYNASPSQKKNSKLASQEIEENEESIITVEDFTHIEKEMSNYLNSLLLVSEHLSLKRYPNILKETMESMLPLVMAQSQCSFKALDIVQNFCNPIHGDTVQTVHHIFIHILPYLIMDPTQRDLHNRDVLVLKDGSFNLIKSLVSKFGNVIYSLVKGLIKYVCFEVVDKAEYRQKTAQTALDLLNLIPKDYQSDILKWFLLLAFADQAFLRMFSLEVCVLLLHQGRLDVLSFAVVYCQCSDPSASVKAKALSLLGECIESDAPNVKNIMNAIFNSEVNEKEDMSPTLNEEEIHLENRITEILLSDNAVELTSTILPKAKDILFLLKERATDDKVFVRKNSLQLLLNVVHRFERFLNKEILNLLGSSCRDVALLIRRHMAQMLTELVLKYPEHREVHRTWSQYVLPLVLDGETRVQEKALECTDQLILHSLADPQSQLAWSLLDIITSLGFSIYLSKAIEISSRRQQLPNKLVHAIQNNVQDRPQAALTLLAIISAFASIDNSTQAFSLGYLEKHLGSPTPSSTYCLQQTYKILGAAVPNMNDEYRNKIKFLSTRLLRNFSMPLELIAPACDITVYCMQYQNKEEDARKEAAVWGSEILTSCGEYLSIHLRKSESVSLEEEEELARRIITLGCVGIHCPREVNKRHFLLLQHAAFQPESGVDAPIPSSQIQSQPTRRLPPKLQAGAIISLGKLSYQHEEIAKQLIPGLGRLLETNPHRAVRNNVVCVLCDWVVRYATAIDPVMPQVTACLRDPYQDVRKQTLILLIHLLQEDYLKIRGTFFFRILQLACDDDESMRDLALFYITQRLLHRQPTIIQQQFIESIFHYNDYKGHPTYNKFNLTEREKKLFSIAGPSNARQRYEIYMFMLQNLDDEARFQLTYRLTRDVLLGVVEDVMSLKNENTEAVLKDTLAVLSSDNIKLASLTTTAEEDPVEKEDIAHAIVQSTKKAIIAQVVKRNVIENIIPIVVALKRKLAFCKSSLMGCLMQFLRELMKDYKDEIEEILAEDRQLMAEIDFDLKRFEQQEKMEAVRPSLANRTERILPPPESTTSNTVKTFIITPGEHDLVQPPVDSSSSNNVIDGSRQEGQEIHKEHREAIELQEISIANSAANDGQATQHSCNEIEEQAVEIPERTSAIKRQNKRKLSDHITHSSSHASQNEVEPSETRATRRSSRSKKTKNDKIESSTAPEPPVPMDDVENIVRPLSTQSIAVDIPSSEEPIEEAPSQTSQHQSTRFSKTCSASRKVREKCFANPLHNATHTRLLKPRIMSTPIRNIAVDDISFNIRDADISSIPHINCEPTIKRRRR